MASFLDLASKINQNKVKLDKEPEVVIKQEIKPVAAKLETKKNSLTADQWLDSFTNWLENEYPKFHSEREPGLHASSIYETCGRKELLMEYYKVSKPDIVAGQQATFDIGHMMHHWWQHRYLGPKKELWGNWFCAGCKTTTEGFMPLDCKCGVPWKEAITYKELPVRDDVLKYVGHTDGILVDPISGERRIFEFKSSSPSDFKTISKKWAHILQAHAYMRVLGPMEAMIIYQNKGSQCDWKFTSEGATAGKLQIKNYVIKYDPKVWAVVEEMIAGRTTALNELEALKKDNKKLTLDVACKYKRICESEDSDAAKYCPVRNQCFQNKDGVK